jgi:hypothetical protein
MRTAFFLSKGRNCGFSSTKTIFYYFSTDTNPNCKRTFSMSFEITGRLAEKFETQKVSDKFMKREFVVEIKSSGTSGYEFVDLIKFQSTQDKCSMLDQFNVDDMVNVSFNLRGRRWERDGQVSYFTNLEAWRIEKVQNETNGSAADSSPEQDNFTAQDAPFPTQPPSDDSGVDDLPF